uniref:Uncharacterized protein n=1 Tax=Anguilla anguilla TaxID=7936 RepID=A0A0E9STH6_ANGAN
MFPLLIPASHSLKG